MQTREITIFHSPDSDDAFMFYGLQCGAVNIPGYKFVHELADIESLNQRTLRGELDVTAVSVHAYAYLTQHYRLLQCGASMGGKDYGPRLVSLHPIDLREGPPKRIALPGRLTSATLAFCIYLHEQKIEAELVNAGFDEIQRLVKEGRVDAGIIIHEGQLTHRREGLTTVLDLGAWWWEKTGLPLPLGANVVKQSLGEDAIRAVQRALRESIDYALAHREEALKYALTYGRGITPQEADTFVGMYVNEWTQDITERGKRSIEQFLSLGAECGLIPHSVTPQFVPWE